MTDYELIEAVAVEVMGWKKTMIFDSEYWMPIDRGEDLNGIYLITDHTDHRGFDPLTNANHWMMVVEKLCRSYLETRIYISRRLFMVDINREGYPVPMDSWCAENKSIGHAVCLAALEAVRKP